MIKEIAILFFASIIVVNIYSQDYFESANIGTDYHNQGKYELALEHYKKSMKLLDELKWKKFDNPNIYFKAAAASACTNDSIQTFSYLDSALKRGFFSTSELMKDSCIAVILNSEKGRILLEKLKTKNEIYQPIKFELETIKCRDQVLRRLILPAENEFRKDTLMMKTFWDLIQFQDSLNQKRIISIIDHYGWLDKSQVGQTASETIWLILVHGDRQMITKYLPLVEEKSIEGKIQGDQYAIYLDKFLIKNGDKQKFGSQLKLDKQTDVYYIQPVQNPESINKLRAEIGMEPIEDYCIFMEDIFGKKVIWNQNK